MSPFTVSVGSGMEKEIGPIPLQLHVACFVIAGIFVSLAYGVDWNRVFS
jgi:hypothetical protein